MGASIADILSNKEKSQLVLPNINKGDVFKMRLTPKEGIIPKNKGDNDRDKYFIIVGKTANNALIGFVVINSNIKSYDEYRKNCDIIAKEAQRYIDFDKFVSCEYINGVGLSILVTLSETDDYTIPECVCPVVGFFEYAKGKDKLSVDDIKKLSL